MSETEATESELKKLALCKVWSNHIDRMNEAGIGGAIRPPPATQAMLSMAYDLARWMFLMHERKYHSH